MPDLPLTMNALRFHHTGGPEVLAVERVPVPQPGYGEALVEVHAAAVNPSDVKNVAGGMPQTRLPRTPGRDFAGRVALGPEAWLGAEVFGSSGELGFVRDGAHAEYVVARVEGLCRRPAALPAVAAASIGVPFVTAWEGLRRARLSAGDVVLVVGGTGAVGRAVAQIARWSGARVIATTLSEASADASFRAAVDRVVDLSREDLAGVARAETAGRGVDVAYNVVGGATFAPSVAALAASGRLVAIAAAPDPEVRFDLRDFYRRDLTFLGVDSLNLSDAEAARILARLAPGFASGALSVPVGEGVPLAGAVAAYQAVGQRGAKKQILVPR